MQGELVVHRREGRTVDDLRRDIVRARVAADVVGEIRNFGVAQVDAAEMEAAAAKVAIEAIPSVGALMPNGVHYPVREFGDPMLADPEKSWGLRAIRAPDAWERTLGGGVTVAVVDTGCDPGHPELRDRLVSGWSFVTQSDQQDLSFHEAAVHGTHVAGTIAATAGNGEGTAGIAPEARLLPLQVIYPQRNGQQVHGSGL